MRVRITFKSWLVFLAAFLALTSSSQVSPAGREWPQVVKDKVTGPPKPNPIYKNTNPSSGALRTPACLSLPVPEGVRINTSCSPVIGNIHKLLETCPASDPATATILADFEIRRNNIPVKTIPCAQPVSKLRLASYTDELILLQALRAIYYMDRGRSGHLPWTKGTLYDWLKSKVRGFNLDDKEAAAGRCCPEIDGKPFISLAPLKNDKDGIFNRELRREWKGLSGLVGLITHERRHADGIGHVSCKVPPSLQPSDNMDQSYDEKNLSCFGVQWWLTRAWLTGSINVGIGCLAKDEIEEIADFHMRDCSGWREWRFCGSPPPALTKPEMVGGKCDDAPATPTPSGPAAPDKADALPTPKLVLVGTKDRSSDQSGKLMVYEFQITNWIDYSSELFKPEPSLPPCTNGQPASRTWLQVYSEGGAELLKFCSYTSKRHLMSINLPARIITRLGESKSLYIVLKDRTKGIEARSNLVTLN